MSAWLVECTDSRFQAKEAACFVSYSRPLAASVALWASKLAAALSAQPSACHVLDPGRKAMVGLDRWLAVGLVAVASRRYVLAGTTLSASVASRA
jgi:hypothetical protein